MHITVCVTKDQNEMWRFLIECKNSALCSMTDEQERDTAMLDIADSLWRDGSFHYVGHTLAGGGSASSHAQKPRELSHAKWFANDIIRENEIAFRQADEGNSATGFARSDVENSGRLLRFAEKRKG